MEEFKYKKGTYWVSLTVAGGSRSENEIFKVTEDSDYCIDYKSRMGFICTCEHPSTNFREATAEEIKRHLSDPTNNIFVDKMSKQEPMFPIF